MLIADPAAELFPRVTLTDIPRFVVAIVSMAIGSGSILVRWLRRKSSERLRLWFGLLALLYGYRTLLMTELARYFFSRPAINFQIALVTFTIGIPAILFGWGLVSKRQNRLTKSLLMVNALMAGTFLLFHSNDRVVRGLFTTNNVLVIAFTIAMIAYLFVVLPEAVPELKIVRIVILPMSHVAG